MDIRKIHIIGLYGYFDKEVDFHPGLNILVGINGSGKTSIINVINWILKPSLGHLCSIRFSKITLFFCARGVEYKICFTQDENELIIEVYSLENVNQFNKSVEVKIPFNMRPIEIRSADEFDNNVNFYNTFRPERSQRAIWNLIKDILEAPLIIGLDRNIFVENDGDRYLFDDNISKVYYSDLRLFKPDQPLARVQEISQEYYSSVQAQISSFNKSLNENLMLSSFTEVITEDNIRSMVHNSSNIDMEQILTLQNKLKDYLKNYFGKSEVKFVRKKRIETEIYQIDKYFDGLKKSLLNGEVDSPENFDNNIWRLINVNEFNRIKKLLKQFQDFDTKVNRVILPIKNYLEVVNSFFIDSAKKVDFNQETGALTFNILDKENNVISPNRDISHLSSGEKQILILFTYLAFSKDNNRIFIIDEPEVSLHIKWQNQFIDSLKKIAKPQNQIIIATHSPNIVGKNKQDCIVLLPFN